MKTSIIFINRFFNDASTVETTHKILRPPDTLSFSKGGVLSHYLFKQS